MRPQPPPIDPITLDDLLDWLARSLIITAVVYGVVKLFV